MMTLGSEASLSRDKFFTTSLEENPDLARLDDFKSLALGQSDCVFQYIWKNKSQEFLLRLNSCVLQPRLCQWRLLSRSGAGARELWNLVSNNSNEVSDKITASMKKSFTSELGRDNFSTRVRIQALSLEKAQELDSQTDSQENTFSDSVENRDRLSMRSPETFEGKLSLVSSFNLFQSIRMDNLTGRLVIERDQAFAHIFFVDGMPEHAEGSRGIGEECILQALCWQDGSFCFEKNIKTDQKTIALPIDRLLMTGALLFDATVTLKNAGLKLNSVIVRANPKLSQSEFDSAVRDQGCNDSGLEKTIYDQSDGKKTVQDIVEGMWLTRSKWVFALANLIRAKLIWFRQPGVKDSIISVSPKQIDYETVAIIEQRLRQFNTGLYSYPALLFLLKHSLTCAPEAPVSVVLLSIDTRRKKGSSYRITDEGFSLLSREIEGLFSFNGIISHYEGSIALALFNYNPDQAQDLARRVHEVLSPATLELAMPASETGFFLSVGLSSSPEDTRDLPTLLALAEAARDKAIECGGGVITAQNL